MTTYHFSGTVAWNRLGPFLTTGRGLRTKSIVDPNTGLTPAGLTQNGVAVTQITADLLTGQWSFTTTDVLGVVVDWGAGPNQLVAAEAWNLLLSSVGTTDSAVAALMGNSASSTRGAGDQVYPTQAKSGILQPATISYTDLQAAANSAATFGFKLVAAGTITTSSTLTLKCDADLTNLTINYTGTGVAVQIGSSAAGQLTRLNVRLGHIVQSTKPAGASWTAGTVGVKVTNIFRSTIQYVRVQDFETGLLLTGDGTYGQGGVAYNTFQCGSLANNLVNQSHQIVAGGTSPFVNQNTFIGGSWSHADGTYPQSGMRHILIGTTGGGSLNNNVWINCSLEGQREEYILDMYGNDNTFLNCRWEFSGTNPPIRWRASAARNLVIGGYQVNELTAGQVIDSGATGNNILGTNTGEMAFTSALGLALSNMTGGTNGALSIMRADWRRLGDTSAGYMTKFEAGRIRLKATADTSDRLFADYSARSIVLGAGSSSSNVTVFWGTGSPEGVVTANQGSKYFNYGAGSTGFGEYMKASGTGNTGWHSVGFQPFTTAGRPAASLAGIGGCYYDTTLSKPGFSDGTTWRDSAGTGI